MLFNTNIVKIQTFCLDNLNDHLSKIKNKPPQVRRKLSQKLSKAHFGIYICIKLCIGAVIYLLYKFY